MPTKRAPTQLAALLRTLREYGVAEFPYDGGTIVMSNPAMQRLVASEPKATPDPRRVVESVRKSPRHFDAVELAVNGIEYDPDEGSEAPGEN